MNEINCFLENDYNYADGDEIYETFRFYEENFRFKEPFDKVIDLFLKDSIDFTSYYFIIFTKYHDFTGPYFIIRAFDEETNKGKEFNFDFFYNEQKLKDYTHNPKAFESAFQWDYKSKNTYFINNKNFDKERFVHGFYEWAIIIYKSPDLLETKTFYQYTSESMLYFMDSILNLDKLRLKEYFDNTFEMINYDK